MVTVEEIEHVSKLMKIDVDDHVYHECCAITYDKDETDDGYQNLCNIGICNPNDTFTLSN